MGFKCGIIGLPNVGKSTLFNALTSSNIEAENFPFCTIEPNIGIVQIPDVRLYKLAKIVKLKNLVPTTIEFVDIAGLVNGSSKGEGLGNKFLNNIRNVDIIGHVVRCFKNDNIVHVPGNIRPVEDINLVNIELVLSDLEICKNVINVIHKRYKNSNKHTKLELLTLEKCLNHLNDINVLRTLKLSNDEKNSINYINFLTLKPTIYIANTDEYSFIKHNSYLDEVRAFSINEGSLMIEVCALLEADISSLKEEERAEFIKELGFKENSLSLVINSFYQILNLQTFFTIGNKEVRAWNVKSGTTAWQASGKIHTDFQKGFIRAQTISFADFINYKGFHGAKKAGRMFSEGKEYIIKDGDVLNFLFKI